MDPEGGGARSLIPALYHGGQPGTCLLYTSKPTVGVYTQNDLDNWSDNVARLCAAAGVTSEDIVQISFGYGLFTGALGLHYGLEKLGATVIPASSGNSEKQLMMLRDFGVTGLVATPSYAIYLSEMAVSYTHLLLVSLQGRRTLREGSDRTRYDRRYLSCGYAVLSGVGPAAFQHRCV